MPFKYDTAGLIVTADHKGVKLPVFIDAKGEEAPFDADSTVTTIARINNESKQYREAKEAAEGTLKKIDPKIIADPAAAVKALDIAANLDAGQLIKVGEVERVKNEIKLAFEAQLTDLTKQNTGLKDELYSEKIGGAFTRSKLIVDGPDRKFSVPVDMVQARFGHHFGIEDGKMYAVDASGNKLYSRTTPGNLADFDEALMMLVDAYPYKEQILKGSSGSGGGAGNGNGNNGGGGGSGGNKGNFGGTREERAAAINAKFPELARGIDVDIA